MNLRWQCIGIVFGVVRHSFCKSRVQLRDMVKSAWSTPQSRDQQINCYRGQEVEGTIGLCGHSYPLKGYSAKAALTGMGIAGGRGN
jgi:hypothetical protein